MARRPDSPMPGAVAGTPLAAVSPFESGIQAGEQVQAALNALRGSLESRIDGLLWAGANGPGSEPVNAALFRMLLEAGFSMPLVRALVERLPAGLDRDGAMAWARNELISHLPVLRNEDQFFAGGGVYALVGPTGVGKTTTLAKLAARCVAREGREQVAMLTTDMFRIGAVEQLQIYGRLLGVPTHSVRDAEELKQALGQLGHRKIILIDTTGLSQRHRNVALQAALLTSADRPVRRLLVLNAASQGDTLDEVAHSYRNGAGDDVAGCIITKLDEATRIASALDTAIRHRLPIHYVSVGQKVPEDMEVADAKLLVDRALATPSQSSALYAPSEADLAALLRAAGHASGPDPARRRQMLAAALMPQQIDAGAHLEKAIDSLESDPACMQAWENWRAGESGATPSMPEAISATGMELARSAFSRCERFLLAMHGKASLKGADLPSGTLHSTLLMTDRGMALSAPVPQLMLPHGVHAAYAQELTVPDNAADALMMRVRALQAGLDGTPLVHLIEMGTAAMWYSLSTMGVNWVTRGTGGLRVVHDGASTTLAAVASGLGYLPAGRMALREQEEDELVLDIWASGTEVSLPARGQDEPATLRLVSAKLTNSDSGEVVNQVYALTNLKSSQADAPMIARWLLQQEQAKPAFRYMVQSWAALPLASGAHSLSRQALYSSQLAAACWQLVNMPKGASVRNLLQAMAGNRKLSAAMLPVALVKGFAMLEMAS
jgi:flagellar biosynthesis protein FlhF